MRLDLAAEPPPDDVHQLLRDHDHDIERACRDLLTNTYDDDPLALISAWRRFERRMTVHMAVEEELILDAFARAFPDDAKRLRRQHDELRAIMTPLGIEVELHVIRATTVERLLALLRAHAAYEDSRMYPWAERNLDEAARAQIASRLG